MQANELDMFQTLSNEMLIRNRSILDTITKYQETAARASRAISKAATHCGCIEIEAKKQDFDTDLTSESIQTHFARHINGQLCPSCKEAISSELGANMFYIASLCNSLGLNINDIIQSETKRVSSLGKFSMR